MGRRSFTPLVSNRAHRDDDLDAFYHRARQAAAWQPVELDWSNVGSLDEKAQETAWILASQSVGTEQVGLLVAAKMLAEVDDYDARAILALQVSDEAKHSDVFEQYAARVGGQPAQYSDAVDDLDNSMSELERSDSTGLYFVHTFLECLALDEFNYLQAAFPNNTLGQIYQRVARDEARHVAFGLRFLRRLWQRESRDESTSGQQLRHYLELAKAIGGINDGTIQGLSRLSQHSAASIEHDLEAKARARLEYLTGITSSYE